MIIYSLETPQKEHLVLTLSVEGEGKKRFLYREFLQSFYKQKVELDLLMKEELAYRNLSFLSGQAETTPFNQVHIPLSRASKSLELLSRGQGLFLKGKRLKYESSQLSSLNITASLSQDKLLVTGALGSTEVTALDWVLPSEAAWCVYEGVLRRVKGKGERFLWNLVFPQASELTGKHKEFFLDKVEDGHPCVTVESPREEEKHSSIPYLMLHDKRGAFASLWMDYGEGKKVSYHDPISHTWRDLSQEKEWEKDLLESGFLAKVVEESRYFCPLDRVTETLTFLLEMGWGARDREGREVHLMSESALSFSSHESHISVSGSLSFGSHKAELASALSSYNRGEAFLPLSGGSVGLIDRSHVEKEWGPLTTQTIIGSQIHVKRSHFGLLASLPHVPKEVCPRLAEFKPAEPGPHFKGVLHPYQRIGLSWLKFLWEAGFHGLLADEMGLGKTVQVLALFSLIKTQSSHLIVMPTSLLFNWRRECEKFLPDTTVTVHSGSKRSTSAEELSRFDVILTSYALLRQDVELFRELEFGCIVLDEAHTIKNPEAIASRAACSLKGRFRLAVSGTPIVNRYEDLWSLFHFLLPDLLGARAVFRAQMDTSNQSRLAVGAVEKKVSPFFLRRTKSVVAKELPPKIEQTVFVEMEVAQATYYDEFLKKGKQGFLKKISEDGVEVHRMEILELILRLRQICCHPHLVDSSTEVPSAKLESLLLDVEEIAACNEKMIIFSQFTSMLSLIEKEVQVRGIPYVTLDGSTKDREKVVSTFTEDPDTLLFLSSLKAGGVGLNLQAADYVFLFDPWWNEAVENQAIDRAHRLGRKGALVAKRYITPYSVEEKMLEIKKAKAQKSLGQMMSFQKLEQLRTQDLLELLERTPSAPASGQ